MAVPVTTDPRHIREPLGSRPMAASVLLVEDEENLASLVRGLPPAGGLRRRRGRHGRRGARRARGEPVRLVVLDLNLPDMDGLDVCRQIRTRSIRAGRDADGARRGGRPPRRARRGRRRLHRQAVLAAGARRADEGRPAAVASRTATTRCSCSATSSCTAARARSASPGEPVELRPKEFDLLAYLIQNQGVVVSRDLLLERVWGYDYAGGTRTVDVHVAQLRRKLGGRS